MLKTYSDKVKINLKKAQGQLALIGKMIDEDRYCLDVAQQVNAAIGLLKQANFSIIESHLLTCGVRKLNSKNSEEKLAFTKELIRVFNVTSK